MSVNVNFKLVKNDISDILKSNSHVAEDFCQVEFFPSFAWKNTNICLIGVLKIKEMDLKSVNFVFLKKIMICLSLWCFALMITYMLTQIILLLLMILTVWCRAFG